MDKFQKDKIQLTNTIQSSITILPNEFIDEYMIKADGEYVKIYLLLLRLINQGIYQGPEQLADQLEVTQKDVMRALHYWEKHGLLQTPEPAKEAEPQPQPQTTPQPKAAEPASYAVQPGEEMLLTRPVPSKDEMSPSALATSIRGTELEHTVFMMETFLGHPLSHNEVLTLYYIEDQLGFSQELLDYLIDYCVTKGKRSIRYMETVAINWYEQEIDSVKKAKEIAVLYQENVFPVLRAFGISNRNATAPEVEHIKKWKEMGFDKQMIVEACHRTILSRGNPSFAYATGILEKWKKNNVRTMKDLPAFDEKHKEEYTKFQPKGTQNGVVTPPPNAFHNFDQREYDYDDLEARLLNNKASL